MNFFIRIKEILDKLQKQGDERRLKNIERTNQELESIPDQIKHLEMKTKLEQAKNDHKKAKQAMRDENPMFGNVINNNSKNDFNIDWNLDQNDKEKRK